MSDEKPKYSLSKQSVREEAVYMRTSDSLGMNLGELRAAIRAAEGLSDESQVRFEGLVGSIVEGEYAAKRIAIRERSSL